MPKKFKAKTKNHIQQEKLPFESCCKRNFTRKRNQLSEEIWFQKLPRFSCANQKLVPLNERAKLPPQELSNDLPFVNICLVIVHFLQLSSMFRL